MERTDGLPPDSPTDTPYQILKAFEYYKHFDQQEERDFIVTLLEGGSSKSAVAWLEKLDRDNKRNSYAWRHSPITDISTFRLDDHIQCAGCMW